MGIDILNPVRWTCPGMDMSELETEFGERICFHGAVQNQHVLPFDTEEEVRAEVRHCIDALAGDGSLIPVTFMALSKIFLYHPQYAFDRAG